MSGFDVSGWKSKRFPSRGASPPINKDKTNPKPLNSEYAKKHGLAVVGGGNNNNKGDNASVKNSSTSFALLGLVFAWIVASLVQSVMIQPILPNTVLKPGTYKSKCGLSGYLPIVSTELKETTKNTFEALLSAAPDFLSCENEFLYVNYDGTVALYDSNRQVTMLLTGDLCSSNNNNGNDNGNDDDDDDGDKSSSSCVDGLVMNGNDKTLEMGGKTIKQVLVRKSNRNKNLSPWPFEEEPAKLRYKIGSTKALLPN